MTDDQKIEAIMAALRLLCHANKEVESDLIYWYNEGFIVGVLAAIGKDWKDLCAGCEGCEYPKHPHRNMKKQK